MKLYKIILAGLLDDRQGLEMEAGSFRVLDGDVFLDDDNGCPIAYFSKPLGIAESKKVE